MTLIETAPPGTITAEQIFEIKTMAETGQCADALIRLRKIKPLYPRNTFLVALEKQLERLLVLPRGSEPSELQRKELLSSLPGLVKGAADSLRGQQPAHARPAPAAQAHSKTDRPDRDVARSQLKDQYFQHADEYLKKGAYGSALVEIRRIKIIAPDDPTVAEYERTIRQLVELQQRTGMKMQEHEQIAPVADDSPRTGVEASPTPAPPVREFDSTSEPLPTSGSEMQESPTIPDRRKSRLMPGLIFVLIVVCAGIAALALLSNPDESTSTENKGTSVQTTAEQQKQEEPSVPTTSTFAPAKVTVAPQPPHAGNPEPARTAQRTETGRPTPQQENAVTPQVVQENPAEMPTPAITAPVELEPEILRLEQPVFGAPAPGGSTGGEVIIMVQIDPNGKPLKTMVAKSTNPALNSAIVTAALRSTYKPGTTPEGNTTTKWITIPFRIQ
jgi:TonB family protein